MQEPSTLSVTSSMTCKAARSGTLVLQVNLNVSCNFVQDVLWDDPVSELRLKLISTGAENYPFKDDD